MAVHSQLLSDFLTENIVRAYPKKLINISGFLIHNVHTHTLTQSEFYFQHFIAVQTSDKFYGIQFSYLLNFEGYIFVFKFK